MSTPTPKPPRYAVISDETGPDLDTAIDFCQAEGLDAIEIRMVDGIAPLAVAIVAVIVLNAIFAFTQEVQAERATEALREYLPPRVRVRRDDRAMEIDARELVPGDVIKIAEGDRLSADARLIEGAVEIRLEWVVKRGGWRYAGFSFWHSLWSAVRVVRIGRRPRTPS